MRAILSGISRRPAVAAGAGLLGIGFVALMYIRATHAGKPETTPTRAPSGPASGPTADVGVVRLSPEQQKAIGLSVVPVVDGRASVLLEAPGQVIPDET